MTPSTFRESAARNFDDLDADGDGFLTRYDYLALAQRRLERTGLRSDTPEGEAVIDAYLNAWETHTRGLDADRDGRISKDDYVRSFDMLGRLGALETVLEPITRAMFTAADRDRDGTITAEEFGLLWDRPGADLTTAFARADVDRDGRITFSEFSRARLGLLIGDA